VLQAESLCDLCFSICIISAAAIASVATMHVTNVAAAFPIIASCHLRLFIIAISTSCPGFRFQFLSTPPPRTAFDDIIRGEDGGSRPRHSATLPQAQQVVSAAAATHIIF
jgi:hypothetical protein